MYAAERTLTSLSISRVRILMLSADSALISASAGSWRGSQRIYRRLASTAPQLGAQLTSTAMASSSDAIIVL